jgi:hypothetical protein
MRIPAVAFCRSFPPRMSPFRLTVEREPGYKPGGPFPCSSSAVHTFQLCPTAIQFVSLSRGERESRTDAIRARVRARTRVRAMHALINARSSPAGFIALRSFGSRVCDSICGRAVAEPRYIRQWQRRLVSSIWLSPLSARETRGRAHPNFTSRRSASADLSNLANLP